MSQTPAQAPKWLLDYNNCSLEELRDFIKTRTGAAVDEKDLLAAHLRKMDQALTFPRFMELPPELRVSVYEYLLVDDRPRDAKGYFVNDVYEHCKLYIATLRTSKQVYAEARPISYNQNTFRAMIGYTHEGSRPAGDDTCGLRIIKPGHRFSFHQTLTTLNCPPPVYYSLHNNTLLGMLRALKHLTIDLGLMTPTTPLYDWQPSITYATHACEALTAVCLVLMSASKLEQLTVKVNFEDSQASDADLAVILWPLILLRSDVMVRIEGVSAALQRETLGDYEERARQKVLLPRWQTAMLGSLVAEVRKRFSEETWTRSFDELIVKLSPLGMWVDMADIVNLSAKWRGLQIHADVLEASNSAVESRKHQKTVWTSNFAVIVGVVRNGIRR